MANRLAWLYMTGKWPKEIIDHRDLDKSNNIWDNLREATYTENNYNVPTISTNTSGYKGVSVARHNPNKWRASISHNNKTVHIGTFDTKEEAYAAYCAKSEELRGNRFTRLK